MLATYMAAICHDYAHKGVNNDFLIKTQDDLAVRETCVAVQYDGARCFRLTVMSSPADYSYPSVPPPQVQYNDRSPMENYHAAATWMKLREEPHNFLKKLPAKVGSQTVAVKKLLAKVHSQRGIERGSRHAAMNWIPPIS